MGIFRLFKRFQTYRKSERGQATLMVALMLLTFLQLFTFVVNIGVVVNAKINLQNAADVAAYAGAAVQARQMTQIAYTNYEMRRALKKFLFRYYVMGTMSQKSFPAPNNIARGWADSGQMRTYRPESTTTAFNAPVLCFSFNVNDNFCALTELPAIKPNPVNPLDSISATLAQQLRNLEQIRQRSCGTIAFTNWMVLNTWLYNTDPTLAQIKQLYANVPGDEGARLRRSMDIIGYLAAGIGLIPREFLLAQRIKNLQKMVNSPPQTRVTLDRVSSEFNAGAAAPFYERTTQAYLSAFWTLGGPGQASDARGFFAFPGRGSAYVEMDELLPGGSDGAKLLELDEFKNSFEVYYTRFAQDGGGSIPAVIPPPNDQGPSDCTPRAGQFNIQNMPVGFAKKPESMVYYAVRLRAKPQLLFNPFGDKLEFSAYSAAMPFGSRIGPPKDSSLLGGTFRIDFNPFVNDKDNPGGRPSNPQQELCADCVGIPNLPLLDQGDSLSLGFNRVDVQASLFRVLQGDTSIDSLNQRDIDRAVSAAMAPNPWEAGRYAIPFDYDPQSGSPGSEDAFTRHFGEKGFHVFYAPISPPETGTPDINRTIEEMAPIFENIQQPQVRRTMSDLIQAYLVSLGQRGQTCGGEDLSDSDPATQGVKECLETMQIHNPMRTFTGERVLSLAGNWPQYLIRDTAKLKTAWSAVKHGEYADAGRSGYSVRFIPLKAITADGGQGARGNLSHTGVNFFSNPYSGPGDEELRNIEH